MFGATIAADTISRGAPQIFVDLGGMTILIRGRRPGETPEAARAYEASSTLAEARERCGAVGFPDGVWIAPTTIKNPYE